MATARFSPDAYVRTKEGGYRFWNSATGDEQVVADTPAAANEAMRINSEAEARRVAAQQPPSMPAGAGGAPGAVPVDAGVAGAGGAPARPVVVSGAQPAPEAPADQGAQGAPALTPPPAPQPPPEAPRGIPIVDQPPAAPRPVARPSMPAGGARPGGAPAGPPKPPPMVLKGYSVSKDGLMSPTTVAAGNRALEAEAAARGAAVEAKADRGEEEARIATRAGGIESAYGRGNADARHQGLRLYDEVLQRRDALQAEIAESKIDSGRFWKNAGAAGQAAAGLGIIAGSIGAAMTGGGARNLALDTIERAIDRDVQDQVAELDKKRYQATELTKYGEDLRRFWGEDKVALGNELKAAHLAEQARRAEALAKSTTDKEKEAQYLQIAADLQRKKADLLAANEQKVKVSETYGPPAIGGGAPKKKPTPYVVVNGQMVPLKPGMSEGEMGKVSTVAMASNNARLALQKAKAEFDKAALGTLSPEAATKAAQAHLYMGAVDLAQAQGQGQATKDNITSVEDRINGLNGVEGLQGFIDGLDRVDMGLAQQYGLRDPDLVEATTEAHLARQQRGAR